jgi:hypothetical protein
VGIVCRHPAASLKIRWQDSACPVLVGSVDTGCLSMLAEIELMPGLHFPASRRI